MKPEEKPLSLLTGGEFRGKIFRSKRQDRRKQKEASYYYSHLACSGVFVGVRASSGRSCILQSERYRPE
ncbi:MAG: hypothetical protein JWR02_1087 [Mucilaginibacter sp.]|nr:hypothetical protein [Mucilaginibacter sp.]